jgi:hypothetical protein
MIIVKATQLKIDVATQLQFLKSALTHDSIIEPVSDGVLEANNYVKNMMIAWLTIYEMAQSSTTPNLLLDVFEAVLPRVCGLVSTLLKRILKDDTKDFIDAFGVCVELLSYTVRFLAANSMQENWIRQLDESTILYDLLSTYRFLASKETDQFEKAPSTPLTDIVSLLFVLAEWKALSERIFHAGFLTCLAESTVSTFVLQQSLEVYINNQRNPWHQLWCDQLKLLAQLIYQIEDNAEILNNVAGLIGHLYSHQVNRRLDVSNEPTIYMGELEEIENIIQLLYQVVHRQSRNRFCSYAWIAENGYQAKVVALTKYYFLLLSHPKTLLKHTTYLTSEELKSSKENDPTKGILLRILKYGLNLLRISTSGEDKLLGKQVKMNSILSKSGGSKNACISASQLIDLMNMMHDLKADDSIIESCLVILLSEYLETKDVNFRNDFNSLKNVINPKLFKTIEQFVI